MGRFLNSDLAWVLFGKGLGNGSKLGNPWVSLGRGMGKVWEGQGLDGKDLGRVHFHSDRPAAKADCCGTMPAFDVVHFVGSNHADSSSIARLPAFDADAAIPSLH